MEDWVHRRARLSREWQGMGSRPPGLTRVLLAYRDYLDVERDVVIADWKGLYWSFQGGIAVNAPDEEHNVAVGWMPVPLPPDPFTERQEGRW